MIYGHRIEITLPPNTHDVSCRISFMVPKDVAEGIKTPDGWRRFLRHELDRLFEDLQVIYGDIAEPK